MRMLTPYENPDLRLDVRTVKVGDKIVYPKDIKSVKLEQIHTNQKYTCSIPGYHVKYTLRDGSKHTFTISDRSDARYIALVRLHQAGLAQKYNAPRDKR